MPIDSLIHRSLVNPTIQLGRSGEAASPSPRAIASPGSWLAARLAIYAVVLLEEHLLFRKGFGGYDVHDWNNYAKLPLGLGAIAALVAGVAGMVLGMSQVYWVGPLAKDIGEYGGDIGFELSFAFAGIVYPIARTIELKLVGR